MVIDPANTQRRHFRRQNKLKNPELKTYISYFEHNPSTKIGLLTHSFPVHPSSTPWKH